MERSVNIFAFLCAVALSFISFSCSDGERVENVETNQSATNVVLQLDGVEHAAAMHMHDFQYKFFSAVNSVCQQDKNILCSPMGASIFLSILANVVDENSADEIVSALGYANLSSLNSLSAKYIRILPDVDSSVQMTLSNALWYQKTYSLNPRYMDIADGYYDIDNHAVDFVYNVNAVIEAINKWVREKTNGHIEGIIDDIGPETNSIFANAMYFSGLWANPFEKDKTEKVEFDGFSKRTAIDMMHNKGLQHYAKTEDFQAVKLEFGKGIIEAVFILPNENTDINGLINGTALPSVSNLKFIDKTIDLWLPSFSTTPDRKLELKKPLQQLGILSLWDSRTSLVFNEPVETEWEISQNTAIEFNEEGAEGASVTWNEPTMASDPDSFVPEIPVVKFNRSFVFLVRETVGGGILFAGKVVDL